jgi:Asp/Glu/hydantoin racemase
MLPAQLATAGSPDLSDALSGKIRQRLAELAQANPDVIVCTCSTIGGAVEILAAEVGAPVLRADRPMAEAAVAAGRRIAVLYAVESTLRPTLGLLREAGPAADVRTVSCVDAWCLFESGAMTAYAQAIAARAREAAASSDVVVLAQASMAPAAGLLTDLAVPVLTSPRTAVERALRAARRR